MSSKKGITAAELMARLNADPAYLRLRAEQDAARAEQLRVESEAEKPLVDALKSIGLKVHSVWDLVSAPDAHPRVISVLVDHLQRTYPTRVREGIIRALSIPEAKEAAQTLVHSFKLETNPDLRWTIGNAISVVAGTEDLESVLSLLRDASFGPARDMLIHGVARIRGADAIPDLIAMLHDADLATQSIIALGNLGAHQAADHVRPFLKHKDPEVRKEARGALRKIGVR